MNNELTHEQKVSRLDNSKTPINTLVENVKEGE